MSRGIKIFKYLTIAIILLVTASYVSLQMPVFQTFLVEKLVGGLNASLGGRVSVGKVYLRYFNTLILSDVSVTDNSRVSPAVSDTLFHSDNVVVTFSLSSLLSPYGPEISKVKVKGGCMNLVIEDNEYGNNLSRIFGLLPSDEEMPPVEGKLFGLRKVALLDFRFTMKNVSDGAGEQVHEGGIDWNDLDVTDINMDVSDMKMVSGVMYGIMNKGSFREKTGFNCRELSGNVRVGNGLTSIGSLRIRDDFSDIFMDNYSMHYSCTEDFSDYINKVRMTVRMDDPSIVDMRSLAFFAPLPPLDMKVTLQGVAEGTVASLHTDGLNVVLPDAGTGFRLVGGIDGLPDMETARIDAFVGGLGISVPAVVKIVRDFSGKDISSSLSSVSAHERLELSSHFTGRLPDLRCRGKIRSRSGRLDYNIRVTGVGTQGNLNISGSVGTKDINVGNFAGTDAVGELSMNTSFRMNLAGEMSRSSLYLDSLSISRLNFNGYDYSGIFAVGLLENGSFDGRIISKDPNLNFMFQGVMALFPVTDFAEYRFFANVGYADLNALNFDTRWPVSTSLKASANFTKSSDGELQGYVKVSDFVLDYDGRSERIGEVLMESSSEPGDYRISLNSDIVRAEYAGDAPLPRFAEHLMELVVGRTAGAVLDDAGHSWSGQTYSLDVRLGNVMGVASYISPGIFIAEGTGLNLGIDSEGVVDMDMTSGRLAIGENYLKTVVLNVSVPDSVMVMSLRSTEARMASMLLGNPVIECEVKDNKAAFSLNYSDGGGRLLGGGRFAMDLGVLRNAGGDRMLDVAFRDSEFFIDGNSWHISPSSLRISPQGIAADSVVLYSGGQSIVVDSPQDTLLNVYLRNFDISPVNVFLEGYNLGGSFSGDISIIDMFGNPGLVMDVRADSARISDTDLGALTLMSKWDGDNDRFNIFLRNSINGSSTVNMTGYYRTSDKYIHANARLNSLSASYFRPLLTSFLSDISGTLSGDLTFSGTLDRPELKSDNLVAENVMMLIDFTKVPYYISGPISINASGVYFNNLDLRDRFGNSGNVNGGIRYDFFDDITFDTRLTFTRMECLNISEMQADMFYGSAFGTGRLELKGPLTSLVLGADVTTYGRTDFHLPLASTADAGATNILTFKEYKPEEAVDPYEAMMEELRGSLERTSNLIINLHLNVTPDAMFHVEIDKASGNVLSGRGAGVLDIGVETTKSIFEIRGDYTIESGNYRFVALNIASRDFTIDSGSKIQFRGDVLDSDMDIKAIYSTKASIGTLIADTSSVSTRRVVNCGLGISGKLLNPTLDFSIDIPDLDPMVRSRVENALSTQDKVQKQFLSLIISNSFLPDEQSSIVNNSSILLSNVTEIMSGQLNSILQKLDIPLDLGLNYQQTDKGTDVFDVAVSTQLFNNRVIVNGNIGNKQNTTTTNSDVVGDIDIEVKLDKPGALRLKIFSHSADQYTSYLDQTQRNGIGITYQQEFSTFRELWRNLFWSRKRKQAAEEENIRRMLSDENREEDVVVKIE